jgi:hypothetical protein
VTTRKITSGIVFFDFLYGIELQHINVSCIRHTICLFSVCLCGAGFQNSVIILITTSFTKCLTQRLLREVH